MAITQAMCTSFKKAILDAEMDFSGDTAQTYKIALYTSSATLDATTTAFIDFADTTWANSTITARGALIYQSGGSNPAVAVLDFGADKTSTAGDFTIQFPTADASNAIIRLA
jgi:hypothetical protein